MTTRDYPTVVRKLGVAHLNEVDQIGLSFSKNSLLMHIVFIRALWPAFHIFSNAESRDLSSKSLDFTSVFRA